MGDREALRSNRIADVIQVRQRGAVTDIPGIHPTTFDSWSQYFPGVSHTFKSISNRNMPRARSSGVKVAAARLAPQTAP